MSAAAPAIPPARTLSVRDTLEINLLGLATIPVIAFCTPRVLANDEAGSRILIPMTFRTRNHVGSMYLGVLCVGADLAAGLPAMRLMREKGVVLNPVFKDLKCDFLKRAVGDVLFECAQGPEIAEAVEHTLRTGERVNVPVHITATVPENDPSEVVAKFVITLSMKHKPDGKLPFLQRLVSRF